MRQKLTLLMICFFVNFFATAQKQIGYVRTAERPNQTSTGIEGATVSIKEKGDITSNKNGYFDFPIKDKKEGESFTITRVQKNGYILIDKQLRGRKFAYSTTVPIEIVMISDKQVARDKKVIEDKALNRAKKTYEKQIAFLKRQLQEQAITDSEYNKERERLSNNFDKYISLIDEMAERYAMTDYKGLSEINREIMQCIENAELERADSLINSKGDLNHREQELRAQMEMNQATAVFLAQSQKDAEFKLNDLAQDYYNKYTILAACHKYDSALYCLERRANLDTINPQWQIDVSNFIYDFHLGDGLNERLYANRALNAAILNDSTSIETACCYIKKAFISNYNYKILPEVDVPELLDNAERIMSNYHIVDKQELARCYLEIGRVYQEMINIRILSDNEYNLYDSLTNEYLNRAIALYEDLKEGQEANIAEIYLVLGDNYQDSEMYYKALSILESYNNEASVQLADAYFHTACALYGSKYVVTPYSGFGPFYENISTFDDFTACKLQLKDFYNSVHYFELAQKLYNELFGESFPRSEDITFILQQVWEEIDLFEKALLNSQPIEYLENRE